MRFQNSFGNRFFDDDRFSVSFRISSDFIYKAILLPTMLYNCTTNVNFSRTQLSMLSSLDNRIEKLCTKKQPPIVNEIKRHTAMLVKKCMLGEVCDNMNGMFVVKQHGIATRNNLN